MQSQPHNLELGVKTFTLSSSEYQKPPPPSPSATTMTAAAAAATLSPQAPSTFLMGDYIGMESCVDLIDDDQEKICDRRWEMNHQKNINNNKNKKMKNKKKEFPPPLPLHMPWVLKRYYTNDGRLIIREEKVKHHEYFKAHRSNGRLTLYLIPIDDDDDDVVLSPQVDGHIDHVKKPKGDICVHDEDTKVMWDNGDDPLINGHAKKAKGDEDVKGDDFKEPKGNICCVDKDDEVILLMEEDHESTMKLCSSMADKALTMENGINGGAAAAGKCFEYKSSMFGMPLLPSMRTVHT